MSLKSKFYPLKPKNADDFKKAVAWFGGREFIASLKGIIMYAIYGENMDPRSWMKPNIYPNIEEKIRYQKVDKVEDKIKAKNKIKAKAEKSPADNENLNSTVAAAAIEEIKNSEDIQKEIIKKINDEWAKKAFDYWEWKRTQFGFWEKYLETANFWKQLKTENRQIDEFWFDYIADSGDGQMGVYGVGCICFSDLWLTGEDVGSEIEFTPPKEKDWDNHQLLPRGYFLFVGGDTAYHSANYATLFERFQTPFRWAFTSVRKFLFENYELKSDELLFLSEGKPTKVFVDNTKKPVENWNGTIYTKIEEKPYWDAEPPRPFFGIPANHDYYDSIDGFNRQFRRAPFEDVEENMVYEGSKGRVLLQIPTFSREQEASYIAIHLPFDWWLFGIDSENEKLDFRQEVFFKQIMEKIPKKLILATPEPTTVFGKRNAAEEKTSKYLEAITESLGFEQPFLTDGKFTNKNADKSENKSPEGYCRLDLSGDVHHYARYWGKNTRGFDDGKFSSDNYASLVSGGGGAFFDSTSTLIGEALGDDGKILIDDDGKKAFGEVPPQKLYPSEKESISRTADKLFDLWNIKKGGYIQYAGAIFSAIIFFFLTQFSNVSGLFLDFKTSIKSKGFGAVTSVPQNFSDLINYLKDHGILTAGIILVAVIALMLICALNLHKLIKKLKEKSSEEKIDETAEAKLLELGRIWQLVKTSTPFFAAVALYGLFILMIVTNSATHKDEEIVGFAKSLFLLFHIIMAGLLVWLSFDYTNWLAVRFKFSRKFRQKTFTEKMEDPNEKSDNRLLKFLGQLSREYSYKYFPANLLVILAVVALIFGIGIFGNAELGKILADLILILVVGGGFVLLVGILAYSTGAAYQNQAGKRQFLIIGLWHAVLQIFTPFILFYYAHWTVVLGIFVLVILLNGFSKAAYRFNSLFPEIKKDSWQKTLGKIVNFRLAAWLMTPSKRKPNKRRLLTVSWFIYGLIVLLTPFAVLLLFPGSESLEETVRRVSPKIIGYFTNSPNIKLTDWIYTALSLLIVASLGYRMSRVWFSWYLGVSVWYNGHNNEAGGMARIEDFKQILRIKVEKDKLTVFVIGLDTVKPNLDENLKLKLVDIFELKCSPGA